MTDITKQDMEALTTAMIEGFQNMQDQFVEVRDRFDSVEHTLRGHGEMIDHIAGRVDDLWIEAGAQTQANRRMVARIDRLEQHLGLSPADEELIAA